MIKKICALRFFHGKKQRFEQYQFADILQYSQCTLDCLYHATPSENEASIVESGLVPGRKPFVYMAGSPEFFNEERKTWFGDCPTLFKIDARRMRGMGRVIYKTADGEYVTDFVPAECLSVVGRMSGGICYNIQKNEFNV